MGAAEVESEEQSQNTGEDVSIYEVQEEGEAKINRPSSNAN